MLRSTFSQDARLSAGNPDYTPPFGNHQVTNGTLGFVDIQQAVAGAGAGFLSSTSFEVRLHVIGIDNSVKTCTTTFEVSAARSYIKKVGAAWSHEYIDPSEEFCRVDPPHPPPVDASYLQRRTAC